MNQQLILIVYDISNDRRRTKLHNVLLDYGTPVQYSVFECHLDPKNLSKMKQAITRVIRKRKDNVRYYSLCADCEKRIESSRPQEVHMSEPQETLVV